VAQIILVRHGETAWSASGRHTSTTDLDLTARGADQARALASVLSGRRFGAVLCSPRRRAWRTAELAGLTVTDVDPDLAEWDYGRYEGRTTADICRERPGWTLWTDGAPGGESPDQVAARADRVLDRVRAAATDADIAVVAHGHLLRVAAARWIGLGPQDGARLHLDTGTLSALGFEHGTPVVTRWNAPVDG
jgi:probable phosphoglycerate mutase